MAIDTKKIPEMLNLQRENWTDMSPEQAGTVIALQRLARLLQRAAQAGLAPLGLTLTEFELLCALRAQPAPRRLTPSALYDAMLISSGGLTKVLDKLEARGFVHRAASATDGRSRPVQLSATGEVMAEQAMAAVQRIERPMMEAMATEFGSLSRMSDILVSLSVTAEAVGIGDPE